MGHQGGSLQRSGSGRDPIKRRAAGSNQAPAARPVYDNLIFKPQNNFKKGAGPMRNIKKLISDYERNFNNNKNGADFKASEAQQLKEAVKEQCREYEATLTEEQIFCAIDVTWKAAYMAGYKKGLKDGEGANV